MKDAPLTICRKDLCRMKTWGRGSVKRLLGTGAGIIFKGSGFYITDYRSEGYKAAEKKESGTSEKTETKADKKAADAPKSPAKKEKPQKSANS
jgi:predicted nucleic acid-binding Zn ribbon protein